jgi:D-sedoheptulose 7-phosphate isomerase
MNSILQSNIQQAIEVIGALAPYEATVESAASLISKALLSGHKLLACGNGGSAADASHLTTEFVCRFVRDRRPYPAICLTTHGGDLTAIGNDYAFNEIFARQVQAFGAEGDVLMVFTTSGQSENVRRALLEAKECGVGSIAMLGKDGGKCTGLADVEFIVRHGVTARIQEAHKLLLHTICELVEIDLAASEAEKL